MYCLSLSPRSPAVWLPITAPMVSATELFSGFVFAVSNELNVVIDRSRIIDGRGLVKGDQVRARICTSKKWKSGVIHGMVHT